jgi:enediyne biosynthesis protein E4
MDGWKRRVVLLALIVALAAGGLLWWRGGDNPASEPTLFRETALDAGIDWQMSFLPNEQGESFKINLYDHGCGLAVGDYDGDGHEDLYFCNQLGPNALFRNRGDGTFEDVTDEAGVALDDRICVAAAFADYNNDGHLDLFVTSTRGGNVLFHNRGDGTFVDVTEQAGLEYAGHCQSAVFFDYDNDGALDLFVAATAQWTTNVFDPEAQYYLGNGDFGGVIRSPKEGNLLYRNNGDGTFTDVTELAGLEGRGWAGDAAAFDYNDDGRLDLLVTSMFGRAQLYRNEGDGTFTDVTLATLGRTPWGGMAVKVFDYNNDGRLDLGIVDMHSDMWMGLDAAHASRGEAQLHEKRRFDYSYGPRVERSPGLIQRDLELARAVGFSHDEVVFGNAFYRNDGNGKFTEISQQIDFETFWPWGIAAGDFDNDGFEDVFIPSGMGYPFYYWPNYLLMNQGGKTFRDQAAQAGIEPPPRGRELPEKIGGRDATRSSRCAVAADLNGDGRLDLAVNNFNDRPYLFMNEAADADNFLALRLRGTRSNRDAVGAVVRVRRAGDILTRQVHGASGYLSQSSQLVHFGLGQDPAIQSIEVIWPSGARQQLGRLELGTVHDVVEPK